MSLLALLAEQANAATPTYNVAACKARSSSYMRTGLPPMLVNADLTGPSPCADRYTTGRWALRLPSADVGKSWARVIKELKLPAVGLSMPATAYALARDPLTNWIVLKRHVPTAVVPSARVRMGDLGQRGQDAACLSGKLFVPANFRWAASGAKLPLGLWGGADDTATPSPPECQKGWQMRLLYKPGRGLMMYMYPLNRAMVATVHVGDRTICPNGDDTYGALTSGTPMPQGRWTYYQLEVVMNQPGYADGLARLWVDGEQVAESRQIIWRCDRDWAIRGLSVNDMWGGNPRAPESQSPTTQSYLVGQPLIRW